MIVRALPLKKPIRDWIIEFDSHELSPPTNADWAFLLQLHNMLDYFTEVTLIMSKSGTPTLPWVIPCMQGLCDKLTAVANSSYTTPVLLRDACAAGITKLDKYVVPMKRNHSNIMATALHPVLRPRWFSKLDDGAEAQAESLFRYVYARYAAKQPQSQRTAAPFLTNLHHLRSCEGDCAC